MIWGGCIFLFLLLLLSFPLFRRHDTIWPAALQGYRHRRRRRPSLAIGLFRQVCAC